MHGDKGFSQSCVVIPAEAAALIVAFRFVVRRVTVEEALRPVVLPDQLDAVLVLNNHILESFRCRMDQGEVSPHGVGLTSEAVYAGGVAVADEGIIIGRPPYIREDGLTMQHIFHVLEIQTRVEHEGEFLFQLVRVFPHTAVQVHQIAVEVVVHFEISAGRFMEEHPSTAAKDLNVPLIFQGKTRENLVPERLFTADPGHETVDRITPFVLMEHPTSDGTLGVDLAFQFTDCLFAGRDPLELITAQADCGETNAEQQSDRQP